MGSKSAKLGDISTSLDYELSVFENTARYLTSLFLLISEVPLWPWSFAVYGLWVTWWNSYQILTQSGSPRRSYSNFSISPNDIEHVLRVALGSGIISQLIRSLIIPFSQRVRIACNAECCNSQRYSVCPSVGRSVRLFVRHVPVLCRVEWRYDPVFSTSGMTFLLVSEEVKFIRIFKGHHLKRGR